MKIVILNILLNKVFSDISSLITLPLDNLDQKRIQKQPKLDPC